MNQVTRVVEILSRHAELQSLIRPRSVLNQLRIDKREYYRILRQIRHANKRSHSHA
mgnify:CR=1 FL=1